MFMPSELKRTAIAYFWVCVLCALMSAMLMCSGCNSTNPLIGPMDTFLNVTGGPYVENRLDAELAAGTKDEDFVKAKKLELQALRALLLEAKGEVNAE